MALRYGEYLGMRLERCLAILDRLHDSCPTPGLAIVVILSYRNPTARYRANKDTYFGGWITSAKGNPCTEGRRS